MLSDLQYRISLLEKVRPVPTGGFSSCQTGTACAGAETEFGAVDAAGALLFEVPELELMATMTMNPMNTAHTHPNPPDFCG